MWQEDEAQAMLVRLLGDEPAAPECTPFDLYGML